MTQRKVVLAYSGGLDTSAIVPWLVETYGFEVHCIVADVGQGAEELEGVIEKARKTGAESCKVADLKQEFVDDYVFPTLIAGCQYETTYQLGTAMARPVIAKAQVEYAIEVGADAVCHGCTGKGNDQIRFEAGYAALAPHMEIIAPWRIWDLHSREDLLEYLRQRDIKSTASATKIFSRDRNLWHISHEGGPIEDPWNAPPPDVWMMSRNIEDTPDQPEEVSLTFEDGRPISLNGAYLGGVELIEQLNEIAGRHGVGRVDIIENRVVGIKSRGLYETPAGAVLVNALRGLEELAFDRDVRRYREHMATTFGELVYAGKWFTPLRQAISAAAESMASRLTGQVVVRLFKGHATVVQRSCDAALYDPGLASFSNTPLYDQKHAGGFIRLWTLTQRVEALRLQRDIKEPEAPARIIP
ncbi:argininosuccinate synthase [Leptolyngbya valderiana BDU 20041]|nr:argininosuccinate synthase [Leptolyngbya valderiana BDU 20041]